MIATSERLIELICESQLLTPPQVEQLTASLHAEFPEPYPLAKELVRLGWLNNYQLRQIAKGSGADLVLGPYTVLEPVGQGSMGVVFKARHRQTGRLAALKVIRKERRDDLKALSRFRREVDALNQLSHPNIVTACDIAEIGIAHYFAMEYLDGINLDRLIAQAGPLPIGPACDYVRQVALGLQHAHERGLIHRDIKPANLLITRAVLPATDLPWRLSPDTEERLGRWGTVKILDLGFVLQHAPEEPEPENHQLTQEGYALGTVDYMPPEQIADPHGVDIRADLYSLGCIFHEMLTGQLPFPAGTPLDKLRAHRVQPPPPVQELRPEVPEAAADVVAKLLAKRREDRYQTPGDLAAALADILVHMDKSVLGWDWQVPTEAPEPKMESAAANPAPPSDSIRLQHLLIAGIVSALIALIVLLKFL